MMYAVQILALLALQLSRGALAQDSEETIWAVFSFNVHGDSTPSLLAQPRELTPLGAKNLYDSGSYFRSRYILGGSEDISPSTWVQGLNQLKLDSEQVKIYTTSDQYNEASALAFMQGMYPPLGNANQSYTYLDDTYILSNGSILASPLNDYQYPQVYASNPTDPNSIFIAGQAGCDRYQDLEVKYQTTDEFQQVESENAEFYSNIYNVALMGVLGNGSVSYSRATDIYEYLEYSYLHNTSLEEALSPEDLQQARVLANQYTFATNGDVADTANDNNNMVHAVAGRTLSRFILQSFLMNMETLGASSKMTLMFGGVEPIVAFASLSRLASLMNSNFYGMPVSAASLVLELFSINSTSGNVDYPDPSDMYVRLLFRNGSSTDNNLTQYSPFSYSPSQDYLPFSDFASELREFLLPSTQSWCDVCNSSTMFCLGVVNSGKGPSKERLSLAGAGAIGAAVTLAVVAIVMGIARLCGIGISRRRKPSALGGFKGTDKMASDQDINFASAKNSIFRQAKQASRNKSHNRLGSWEMNKRDRMLSDDTSRLNEEEDITDINVDTEAVKCHQIV